MSPAAVRTLRPAAPLFHRRRPQGHVRPGAPFFRPPRLAPAGRPGRPGGPVRARRGRRGPRPWRGPGRRGPAGRPAPAAGRAGGPARRRGLAGPTRPGTCAGSRRFLRKGKGAARIPPAAPNYQKLFAHPPQSLDGMFAEYKTEAGEAVRRHPGLPRHSTTDPQAEVLVFGRIQPRSVFAVHLQSEADARRWHPRFLLDGVRVRISEALFGPRVDYRAWGSPPV